MSYIFNSRDWKKNKPKETRKKVIRIRADTYKIEWTNKGTDRLIEKITKAEEGRRDGAGGREHRPWEASGCGGGDLPFPSIHRDWFAGVSGFMPAASS